MAVYWLPAVKNMTLSRQRLHGLIPLSDRSLTHLYPTCLLRKDSLHLCFALSKTFILSLCYSSLSPAPVPFAVFLNDFPVTISNPPLCLCQCVRLYYNGVPAVDKCRHEKKGETFDWSSRVPSLTSLAPLIPHLQSISDPWHQHLEIWTDWSTELKENLLFYTSKISMFNFIRQAVPLHIWVAHTNILLQLTSNTPQAL